MSWVFEFRNFRKCICTLNTNIGGGVLFPKICDCLGSIDLFGYLEI